METYGTDPDDVELIRKRFDKKRANYFFANTAKRWDDFTNYDIVLDVSALGIDGCVQALKSLMEME